MRNKKIHVFALSLIVALVLGTSQQVTYARTSPGSVGRTPHQVDQVCFTLSFSSMTNNCGSVKRIDFPLVQDTAGSLTARVRAQGAGAGNNVICELVAWDAFTFATSGQRALPVFGSPQFITLTNNFLLVGDSVFVGCDVLPGGTVHTLLY